MKNPQTETYLIESDNPLKQALIIYRGKVATTNILFNVFLDSQSDSDEQKYLVARAEENKHGNFIIEQYK